MRGETWGDLRADAVDRLRRAPQVDDAEREVAWLLEEATGLGAAEQRAAAGEHATHRKATGFLAMVERRCTGEPLQYVLGHWAFRTLDLMVDRRVLIPRPETEVVAGLAIDAIAVPRPSPAVVVDLGTGSGAIALSVAAERWPHVEVWAVDRSPDALAVARANLAALGRRATAVRLVEGDWFSGLPGDLRGRVDVVVANPPYVAEGDPLPVEVAAWEPRAALVAGPRGTEAVEQVVREAPRWLAPGGTLVVEIGEAQGGAAGAAAAAAGLVGVRVLPDLAGRPRALVAHAPPEAAP